MACSSREAEDSSFPPLESAEPEETWTVVGHKGAPGRTHPLYKKVSLINGQVNACAVAEVKEKLQELGLCKR